MLLCSEVTNNKPIAHRINLDLAIDLMYVYVTVAYFADELKEHILTGLLINPATN